MSKLESLVPPLELCKLIPAGEFADSAFIWDKTTIIGFWDGEDGNCENLSPQKAKNILQVMQEQAREVLKEVVE